MQLGVGSEPYLSTAQTLCLFISHILIYFLEIRSLVSICSVKTVGPFHVYYIHFGQYSYPMGSGRPRVTAGEFSITGHLHGNSGKSETYWTPCVPSIQEDRQTSGADNLTMKATQVGE